MRFIIGVLVAVSTSVSVAFAQSGVELTIPDVYRFAISNLQNKNPLAALKAADALIQHNPADAEAKFLRIQALRQMNRYAEAEVTAKDAWRVAKTDQQKFNAALLTAQALSQQKKFSRAQIWLRRAGQIAPSPEMKNIAVRDFKLVRNANPWQTFLSFSMAPNSNINNGSTNTTSQLFDLPFSFELSGDAQALAGYEFSTGLDLRYRLKQTRTTRHSLQFSTTAKTYALSSEAKAQAPDVKGSDYAFEQYTFGYNFVSRPSLETGPFNLGVAVGTTRYGGDPYQDFARINLSKTALFSKQTSITVSGGVERKFGKLRFIDPNTSTAVTSDDVDIKQIRVSMRHLFNDGSDIGLSIGYVDSASEASTSDYHSESWSINFAHPEFVIFGGKPRFTYFETVKDFPVSSYSGQGRLDKTRGVSLSATFRDIEFYGFSPSVSYSYSKTDSNIGLFEKSSSGLNVSIRSAF